MLNDQPATVFYSNFRRFFAFGIAFVIAIIGAFWLNSDTKILLVNKNLLTVPWPTELEFAGERVPLENFYVREAWEKEFLINLSEDYQNLLYLKRSRKYFPLIEAELAKNNLPADLKYVAVAESGLREEVVSHAGASGIWQFIPATGKRFGLRIDDAIDERHHFEKATAAAIQYFLKLHEKFDNWTLATAAYNAGENGIARQLAEQKVNDYYDLDLNSETARYIFRIVAIKQILEHPSNYGYELADEDYFAWPELRTVSAGKTNDLAEWARANQTTLRAIKELNPWIIKESLPAGNWVIRVAK